MTNAVSNWRKNKELHNELGKPGKIVVWTKIFVAPSGFTKQVPYVVAIIEFAEKERRTLQLVDFDEKNLRTGQKVITVVRRIGSPGKEDIITYGIKVKPI